MSTPLPHFRFHPDPLQSGCITDADLVCGVCDRARGYIYAGNCYVEEEFEGDVCPWCIADGSAHRRFGMTFHEFTLKPGTDLAIVDEIEERTPGLASFHPVEWPWCCGLPMAYLEPAGHEQIVARHATLATTLVPQLATDHGISREQAQALFDSLQRDESPCAHVFRCLTCATLRAQIDVE